MANGIVVNGDGNSLVFSTDTDNLFYQGKATFYQAFSSTTYDYAQAYFGTVLYNDPSAVIYEYRITLSSNTTAILPFIYNSIGKRVGITNIRKLDSTTWSIMILACTNPNNSQPAISSTTYLPVIYVFSNYIDAAVNTGYGINVFDGSGQTIFTTNERPLLLKAIYSSNVQYSNLQRVVVSGLPVVGNGPSVNSKYITYINPVSSVSSMSKPAIFFSGNQTARYNDGVYSFVFESTAVFNSSTTQLALEWAYLGQYFSQTDPTLQSSTLPFVAFIIDGAQYD